MFLNNLKTQAQARRMKRPRALRTRDVLSVHSRHSLDPLTRNDGKRHRLYRRSPRVWYTCACVPSGLRLVRDWCIMCASTTQKCYFAPAVPDTSARGECAIFLHRRSASLGGRGARGARTVAVVRSGWGAVDYGYGVRCARHCGCVPACIVRVRAVRGGVRCARRRCVC